jgi:methylmalonyl-CoA/ethylmalonyl-CoA epimerase
MGATKIHDPFDLPEQGVKVCFVDTPAADGALNGTQIELIEPLPGNTSIAGFLEKNPQGGQHHVCYEVPDIHAAKAEFEAMGKRVLGEPRIGAHGTLIFFVHPQGHGRGADRDYGDAEGGALKTRPRQGCRGAAAKVEHTLKPLPWKLRRATSFHIEGGGTERL